MGEIDRLEEPATWLYEASPPGRPLYYVAGSNVYDLAGEHRFTIVPTSGDSWVVYPIGSTEPAFEVCDNWFYVPGIGGHGVMYSALGDPRPWDRERTAGKMSAMTTEASDDDFTAKAAAIRHHQGL